MLQDLYAVISTLKPSSDRLPISSEDISNISPSSGQKASVISLLDDNETLRSIKIYPSSQSPPTPPAEGQSAVESQHYYKYHAGFLPASPPEDPYILWADVYYKPTSHPEDKLLATNEIVEKVRENEPGTLCYLWLQDVQDERHISAFEMYRNKDDLKVHEGTEWYAEYGRRLLPGVTHHVFREAQWKGGCFEGFGSGV